MLRKTNLIWENLYSVAEADIVLLGVPFDSTISEIPGTRFAPNQIREDFQLHVNNFDAELGDLEDIKLHDAGNIEVLHGNIEGTHTAVYEAVKEIMGENPKAKLLVLGGEHSITYPIVRALSEKKKFSYLCYDAHTDLWDTYNGLKNSHACVNRRVYDLIKNVEIRGCASETKEIAEFAKKLKPVKDPVYLSVDVDVFSDKVGCPVSYSYDFEKMWGEIKKRDIIAADIVEYNPMVGRDVRVAELVKRLLLSL
jgi:agmatinase